MKKMVWNSFYSKGSISRMPRERRTAVHSNAVKASSYTLLPSSVTVEIAKVLPIEQEGGARFEGSCAYMKL